MTFPDYAQKETSELVEQLMTRRADEVARHLRTVREALDEAARRIETPADPDPEIREVAGRLGEAFADAARRIREEAQVVQDSLRGDLDSARADLEATGGALQAEQQSSATLASSLAELQNDFAALGDSLRDRQEQIEDLEARLSVERARAEAVEHDLAAARQQIEQLESACAAASASSQLASQLKASLEEELRDSRGRLQRAEALAADLTQQVDSAGTENARLKDAVSAAESRVLFEAQARSAAEREIQDLRASLDDALADLERLGARLEAVAAEKGRLTTGLSTAQSELQTALAHQDSLGAQLRAQAAKVQALERSHARHEEAILQSQARSDSRSADTVQRPSSSSEVPVDPVVSRVPADLAGVLSVLEASVQSADSLGAAATIPDLMNALLAQLSAHFSRVALFTVKGNRLAGESQIGFDHHTYVRKMVIPLGVDSMLTRVANTGRVEWCRGEELVDESKGAPFRGTPAVAVALPLSVREEIVAVVYADDAAHGGEAQEWAVYQVRLRLAGLLVRQAALALMRLTQELRAVAELREYATTLIESAEQMYLADVESRRTPDEPRRRLQENLDCARQIFEQRASREGVAASTVLDDQIAALVQSRTDDQFARELAGIVGIPYAAPPQNAEAS